MTQYCWTSCHRSLLSMLVAVAHGRDDNDDSHENLIARAGSKWNMENLIIDSLSEDDEVESVCHGMGEECPDWLDSPSDQLALGEPSVSVGAAE